MALAEYMYPLEGETPDEHADRLFRDFLWARGGNRPEDVARWLREYTADQLAAMYEEAWGGLTEDDDEYVPASSEDIAAGVELFEEAP